MRKVTPELLVQVAQENQRTNQIGGNIRDGLGWDVGHDMGLITPGEAAKLPISAEAARGVAPEIGRRVLSNAEQIANARRHEAQARQHRRDSGF